MAYKYHPVSTKFWTDETVITWDNDTQLLALYLLTCPHRTSEGLFRLPKQYILADLRWSQQRLTKPFSQLLEDGFLMYDESVSVLLLCQALKYQQPENPNQEKSALKAIVELPQTPLLHEFELLMKEHAKRLYERYSERIGKSPTPTLTQTQGDNTPIDSQARDLAKTIYDFLKNKDALPSSKGWFMAQVGIAKSKLLPNRPFEEWNDCLQWAMTDSFWSGKLSNLSQLGGTVWSQYARNGKPKSKGESKPFVPQVDEVALLLAKLDEERAKGVQ